MMGVPPDQAKRLTWWEFTAMRYTWNERHKPADVKGDPVEPPTEEFVRAAQAELAELGISGAAA